MTHILKLGTRKSLLALAQSRTVARQLEQNNTDLTIELVGIETRGDRILDVPLSKMEGKEFFVAEDPSGKRTTNNYRRKVKLNHRVHDCTTRGVASVETRVPQGPPTGTATHGSASREIVCCSNLDWVGPLP